MNVEKIIKSKKSIPLKKRTFIHFILIYNHINDSLSKGLKPFDVSLQQFNVMRILRGQNNKPANLSTINDRMVNKMSNTTRLVDKLIAKGYVKRMICPTNRRKVEISITTKGLNELKKMDLELDKIEKEALKNFKTPELEQLNMLLDKF